MQILYVIISFGITDVSQMNWSIHGLAELTFELHYRTWALTSAYLRINMAIIQPAIGEYYNTEHWSWYLKGIIYDATVHKLGKGRAESGATSQVFAGVYL
jgi:hypothetical protein